MLARFLALAALLFPSCIPIKPPATADLLSADIGEPPDVETARIAAKWAIAPYMGDPNTAIWEYPAEIRRGWFENVDTVQRFAWSMPVHITDRGYRGTYGSPRIHEFFFLNDTMIAHTLSGQRTGWGERLSMEFVEPVPLAPFREGTVPAEHPKGRGPTRDPKAF